MRRIRSPRRRRRLCRSRSRYDRSAGIQGWAVPAGRARRLGSVAGELQESMQRVGDRLQSSAATDCRGVSRSMRRTDPCARQYGSDPASIAVPVSARESDERRTVLGRAACCARVSVVGVIVMSRTERRRPFHGAADRAGRDLRRPGRHRHREHAAVRGGAGADARADRGARHISDGRKRCPRCYLAARRLSMSSRCSTQSQRARLDFAKHNFAMYFVLTASSLTSPPPMGTQ